MSNTALKSGIAALGHRVGSKLSIEKIGQRSDLAPTLRGWRGLILSAAGALLVCGTHLAAQSVSNSPQPEAGLTPEARQVLLQPAVDRDNYRLGRGDVLSINVQGRPELTGKQTIGPDGNVSLPLIGSVSLVSLTREQAAVLLREKLLRYYTDPAVTVGVDTYTSNEVLLVGAVEHPGAQIFERQPTLLEVLARGGGLQRSTGTFGNQFTGITGTSHALPDRVTIYRGDQTAINVDVAALVHDGNALASVKLMRDDVVYVPSSDDRYISILGQVQHPGAQPLEHETTLARLLSNAGGLTKEAGQNPTLHIVEPSTGKTRLVAFKDLLNPSSTEIPLHSGDVLYIPESKFSNFAYVVDRLSPLVNIFTTAAFLEKQ